MSQHTRGECYEASTQAICVGNRDERRILKCKKMSKVRNFNIYTPFCVKKPKVAMDKPCSVNGGEGCFGRRDT
jgi:hypothetical protein